MGNLLSIVVASRNDNHGGDMTRRMRLFINGVMHQCNKFNLQAELIFVEWNPPAGQPLLSDILPKPKDGDKLSVRYIVVPQEIHNTYLHSKTIPLFQMIAKNVGIRRAKGEFVLCTNIDLLFSDKLMEKLTAKELEHGKFYRANRCDVPKDISESISIDEQLAWCEKNIMERNGLDINYFNLAGIRAKWVYKYSWLKYILNIAAGIIRPVLFPESFMTGKIDSMACGDFTLMSKEDWMKIEGYAEMDLYSIHIDTMALYAAVASGIKQVLFPPDVCTYHMHHEDGWSSLNPLKLLSFLEKRPGLDWSVVYESGKYIIENKSNFGINKPDWGFANQNFREIAFNTSE